MSWFWIVTDLHCMCLSRHDFSLYFCLAFYLHVLHTGHVLITRTLSFPFGLRTWEKCTKKHDHCLGVIMWSDQHPPCWPKKDDEESGGVRVTDRKRRLKPAFPSIVMGNVCSPANKVVKLTAPINAQWEPRESSLHCYTAAWTTASQCQTFGLLEWADIQTAFDRSTGNIKEHLCSANIELLINITVPCCDEWGLQWRDAGWSTASLHQVGWLSHVKTNPLTCFVQMHLMLWYFVRMCPGCVPCCSAPDFVLKDAEEVDSEKWGDSAAQLWLYSLDCTLSAYCARTQSCPCFLYNKLRVKSFGLRHRICLNLKTAFHFYLGNIWISTFYFNSSRFFIYVSGYFLEFVLQLSAMRNL